MAYEVESGMFVRHKPCWQDVGVVVQEAPTTEEAIKLAGLDWKVKELPVLTYEKGGIPQQIEGYKALRRDDNDYLLNVCHENWTPVQNMEAFKFFDPILQSGDAKLDAAICLKKGKRIVITAKLTGHISEVLKDDVIEQNLILHNCHDSHLSNRSLGILFSNERVVCGNTLGSAIWDAKKKGHWPNFVGSDEIAATAKAVRLRHTPNINENLMRVQKAIEINKRQFDVSLLAYKAMASKELTEELYRKYLENVFRKELDIDGISSRPIADYKHYEQLRTNFESGRGMDVPGVSGTLWGAFQSVTEWVTHQRTSTQYTDEVESTRNRLNQMWFGSGAEIIENAQTEALAML